MQKKQTIFVVASLLVVVLSVTLAYFTAQIIGEGKNISVTSADLKIVFTDTDGNIEGSNITPGWSNSKTFTVKNESNGTYKYDIIIKDLINTFKTYKYLQYKITSTDGGYNMTDYSYLPKASTKEDVALAYEVSIDKGKTHTYTIEIKYINDEYVDQSIDMGKSLSGTIYIREFTKPIMKLTENYNDRNPENETECTSTNICYVLYNAGPSALYKAEETEENEGYLVGLTESDCNGEGTKWTTEKAIWSDATKDIYWRIIRTNADGSIKLLYAGTSPDTDKAYIGMSEFNTTYNDPMYVGYKYGTTGSLENNRLNTNNSTIKTYVDNWYKNNLTAYTKYLSKDAVYCNDRSLASGETYSTTKKFNYAPLERIYGNKQPTYNCTNMSDAFSVNNTSAKLDYPVGLMTIDELSYAGGEGGITLDAPYAWYYTNANGKSITGSEPFRSFSPSGWGGYRSDVLGAVGSGEPGYLLSFGVADSLVVRPSVSLSSCNLISRGNGSPENPYEIYTGSGVCE